MLQDKEHRRHVYLPFAAGVSGYVIDGALLEEAYHKVPTSEHICQSVVIVVPKTGVSDTDHDAELQRISNVFNQWAKTSTNTRALWLFAYFVGFFFFVLW